MLAVLHRDAHVLEGDDRRAAQLGRQVGGGELEVGAPVEGAGGGADVGAGPAARSRSTRAPGRRRREPDSRAFSSVRRST